MNDSVKIDPLGFREYDARWLYPKDINKEGIKNVGQGLGSQIISKTNKSPRVIVGHDYRSYSEEVKKKLMEGLIDTGCNIEDIGLALSPTAYFAQFNLNADAVAMVTASHNENGWTGIKMGIEKGLTHSPAEMNELKKIVLEKKFIKGKGSYKEIKEFEGKHLSECQCEHPFKSIGYDFIVRPFHGDFVNLEQGTGIVHIAPGHGDDDCNLGIK